jgi:hypothetical protein
MISLQIAKTQLAAAELRHPGMSVLDRDDVVEAVDRLDAGWDAGGLVVPVSGQLWSLPLKAV